MSVRVSYGFPTFLKGSVKYQTCLVFHQSTLTLDPDCGSRHKETGLSVSLYVLSCLLPDLSERLNVLSGNPCHPDGLKYPSLNLQQALE